MPVVLVCYNFCDKLSAFFGFNSVCQSYSDISDLLVVSLFCMSRSRQCH